MRNVSSSDGVFAIVGVLSGAVVTGCVALLTQRKQFQYARSLARTERVQQGRAGVYIDLMQYVTRLIDCTEQGGRGHRDIRVDLDDRLEAAVFAYGSVEAVSKVRILVHSIQDMQTEITGLESKVRAGDPNPSQDAYLAKAALVVNAAVQVRNQIRCDLENDQLP